MEIETEMETEIMLPDCGRVCEINKVIMTIFLQFLIIKACVPAMPVDTEKNVSFCLLYLFIFKISNDKDLRIYLRVI